MSPFPPKVIDFNFESQHEEESHLGKKKRHKAQRGEGTNFSYSQETKKYIVASICRMSFNKKVRSVTYALFPKPSQQV